MTFGYMDYTDFRHELGSAPGGSRVYASVEDTLRHSFCAKKCGIAKVQVEFVSWEMPTDFSKPLNTEEHALENAKKNLENAKSLVAYLEQHIKELEAKP